MTKWVSQLLVRAVLGAGLSIPLLAQKPATAEGGGLFIHHDKLEDPATQRDFPAMCLDADGTPWVVYIEYDGKADTLWLAKKTPAALEKVVQFSTPGVLHQPAIARDGSGALWCFWGELGSKQVFNLRARRFADGKADEPLVLAESAGSDTFAHAGTDHAGRVWVVWQSLRRGQADIFTRYYDPKTEKWSDELSVAGGVAGNWEPRIAFDGRDGAWIVFDSSRGGNEEFNLFLAHVELDGKTQLKQLTQSPAYEARASIAAAPDGKGFWIAAERGLQDWGKVTRGKDLKNLGLNQNKQMFLGYYEIATGTFVEMPSANDALAAWGETVVEADEQRPHKPNHMVNLPQVAVDAVGNPWVAVRWHPVVSRRSAYFNWRIILLKFDRAARGWSQPVEVPDSAFYQDRHCDMVRGAPNKFWICWPSDRRLSAKAGASGVYLSQLDCSSVQPVAAASTQPAEPPLEAMVVNSMSPDHSRIALPPGADDQPKGGLYWGDLHRHTDVSICGPWDSCAVDAYRYSLDVAKLDFLGISDHIFGYTPYEWWHNARLADVFYVPGRFNPLYAYEHEQPGSYDGGHRNVIFARRGGPLVRLGKDGHHTTPEDIWQMVRDCGVPVTVISHTGVPQHGTRWDRHPKIDNAVENVVEIFQGCRISYEGLGAPQPTIGYKTGERFHKGALKSQDPSDNPTPDFGDWNGGFYQNALRLGHKLGVFASSDHYSTGVSFGGVYPEKFTREGIVEAINARRTIAATAKIGLDFSCNGHRLGSIFTTSDKPALKIAVKGTAPISRVTIIRNETDYKVFKPDTPDFAVTFTDESPIEGENRYYIRVEQKDGNMAWASPVWVTFKRSRHG